LMGLDKDRSATIGIDKFMIETRLLGMYLSEEDLSVLLTLYENRDKFNAVR